MREASTNTSKEYQTIGESKSIFVHRNAHNILILPLFFKRAECKKRRKTDFPFHLIDILLFISLSRFPWMFLPYLYILFSRKKCQNTPKTMSSHMTNNCVNGQQLFITFQMR